MRKLNMDELNRLSVEKFIELDKLPVICILDNIRSQHNIGSIFRTSDAFRIKELYLCGITATPEEHRAYVRSRMRMGKWHPVTVKLPGDRARVDPPKRVGDDGAPMGSASAHV